MNDSIPKKKIKENSIYLKVSDEIRKIIDKHKKNYGISISHIVEDSLIFYDQLKSIPPKLKKLLNKYDIDYTHNFVNEFEKLLEKYDELKNNQEIHEDNLWMRARNEMEMMLIGKTTFHQFIAAVGENSKNGLHDPKKRNVGFDIILWYTGKPIKNLSFEDLIKSIQKLYVVANYFYLIDVKKESDDQYFVIFKHRENKRYSEYWRLYFNELFSSDELSFRSIVEAESLEETLSLTIKKIYDVI